MGRPRKTDSDLRHGRHCVFALHVHLVFVTKYRRNVFKKEHLDAMQLILANVCRDFEAELVEFNGEHDHVHLLVNYPPKVALSNLVASLKRRVIAYAPTAVWRLSSVAEAAGRVVVPSHFASSCGGAPIDILRQYIEEQQAPH
ncbi:IS200/IS605 family transposase [Cupriavidus basilensis]